VRRLESIIGHSPVAALRSFAAVAQRLGHCSFISVQLYFERCRIVAQISASIIICRISANLFGAHRIIETLTIGGTGDSFCVDTVAEGYVDLPTIIHGNVRLPAGGLVQRLPSS
jgi:hypothetical protein